MDGSRGPRWTGLGRLALSRLRTRALRVTRGRTAATAAAVAVTVALLLVVTGVALALADGGVATDDDADVRLVADDGRSLSSVDGVESPRIGDATAGAETIRATEGVDHASPILVETVAVRAGDSRERLLLVGVVPDGENRTVAGLPTGPLGEPAGGDGWRGEAVASAAAADRLGVDEGEAFDVLLGVDELEGVEGLEVAAEPDGADELEGADDRTAPEGHVVTAVADGETPVVLVHLPALGSHSGADDDELAEGILIWGEEEAAVDAATETYPEASTVTADAADPAALVDDGLALATVVVALIVGLSTCSLFVATTAALSVEEDRRTLAILAAVGFPVTSRLAIVTITIAVTSVLGALLGVGLGVAGVVALNAVGTSIATGTVAHAHPFFLPYGIAVALAAGLLAAPYPLTIAARTDVIEELER